MVMLRLHDTLSGTTSPFQPAAPTVKLYVCGVTLYDTTHHGIAYGARALW
jgi:cysteinyl-tRNA synthetase